MLPIVVLAAGEYTPITWTDFSSVITNLQSQLSVATVVGVLAQIASICVGLAFAWWGIRKATKALWSAFRKGRIRL